LPVGEGLRRITGFHQDEEGHWVAELECGHNQHMRHEPPWQLRPWTLTQSGRDSFVGVAIACAPCTAGPPGGDPHLKGHERPA
jgi:hypothetical protein